MKTTAKMEEVLKVIYGDHSDPFSILGMHLIEDEANAVKNFSIRAFISNAKEIKVIDLKTDLVYPMEKLHEEGFFEVTIHNQEDFFP